LVSVPLVAALVFDAPAKIIGLLIAAQSLAHLLGSLPFGLIIDRIQPKKLAVLATLVSCLAFFSAALCVMHVCLSVLPKITNTENLTRANSNIELPRALASFAIPLVLGIYMSTGNAGAMFLFASLSALTAAVILLKFPHVAMENQSTESIVARIQVGGRFVIENEHLRPIMICSLFWNLAFSALLVVTIPLITEVYQLSAGVFGVAMASFGFAAVLGSFLVGRLNRIIPRKFFLTFGPVSSVFAILVLILLPADGPSQLIYVVFFFIGLGPSMWLVTQNSIRQAVTPAKMLGRVNAVIQTAIYGVRPLGAVLGGVIVTAFSADAGLYFVLLSFIASAQVKWST